MSTTPIRPEARSLDAERNANRPGRVRSRAGAFWSIASSAALVLASALLLFSASQRGIAEPEATSLPAPVFGAVAPSSDIAVMPSAPVDGVLTMVIPPGAAADQQAGGRGYEMPPVISLEVGDTIVIRNDDDAPHMILYTFLMPGETNERTFTEIGSEVYSSGCGLNAASFLNFTSIFISEPGKGAPTV